MGWNDNPLLPPTIFLIVLLQVQQIPVLYFFIMYSLLLPLKNNFYREGALFNRSVVSPRGNSHRVLFMVTLNCTMLPSFPLWICQKKYSFLHQSLCITWVLRYKGNNYFALFKTLIALVWYNIKRIIIIRRTKLDVWISENEYSKTQVLLWSPDYLESPERWLLLTDCMFSDSHMKHLSVSKGFWHHLGLYQSTNKLIPSPPSNTLPVRFHLLPFPQAHDISGPIHYIFLKIIGIKIKKNTDHDT